jgi:hypothetical protein
MTLRAHLAREPAPLPTGPLTAEELDALDARMRDDVGPADGFPAVVYGFETLAALAGAWPRASAELRALRQRLRALGHSP